MEEEVGNGAGALLLERVRGLEDESGLDREEEAGLLGVSMIRLSGGGD